MFIAGLNRIDHRLHLVLSHKHIEALALLPVLALQAISQQTSWPQTLLIDFDHLNFYWPSLWKGKVGLHSDVLSHMLTVHMSASNSWGVPSQHYPRDGMFSVQLLFTCFFSFGSVFLPICSCVWESCLSIPDYGVLWVHVAMHRLSSCLAHAHPIVQCLCQVPAILHPSQLPDNVYPGRQQVMMEPPRLLSAMEFLGSWPQSDTTFCSGGQL